MKRDMELVRKILLKIEEEQSVFPLMSIEIDGYDMPTVNYHCKILDEAGLISGYKASMSMSGLDGFRVDALTWQGNDFLDKIRDNGIWHKTKEALTKKGLPLMIETIKTVANAFITAAAEGVANSILKNGGA